VVPVRQDSLDARSRPRSIHRFAGETDATVWIEPSAPCEVVILGERERTFCVEGHHDALVVITGLVPGRTYPYQVHLDGELRWPAPNSGFAPSVIRTLAPDAELDVHSVRAASRCRTSRPTR